jgi:hypothetical protein
VNFIVAISLKVVSFAGPAMGKGEFLQQFAIHHQIRVQKHDYWFLNMMYVRRNSILIARTFSYFPHPHASCIGDL